MVIGGFRLVPLLKKTVREIGEDNIPSLAATTAYYFFFSLFPLFLFLGPLVGLVGDKQKMMGFIVNQLVGNVPPEQVALLTQAIAETVFSPSAPAFMSLGALLAAYSGSTIFGSLMNALNIAYDVREKRPWWKKQAIRLSAFVVGGIIVVISTVVILNGEGVAAWLGRTLHLGRTTVVTWTVLQFPLAFLFLVALAFLIFYVLPCLRQSWRHALVAAVVTTVLWIAATLLFRVYLQHFNSYNKTYGAIGGIIILLTWMYYTMFVVLAGGELASELHHGTGAVAPEKGAIYFGRIVSDTGPGSPSTGRPAQ
jgi:membrane protein